MDVLPNYIQVIKHFGMKVTLMKTSKTLILKSSRKCSNCLFTDILQVTEEH